MLSISAAFSSDASRASRAVGRERCFCRWTPSRRRCRSDASRRYEEDASTWRHDAAQLKEALRSAAPSGPEEMTVWEDVVPERVLLVGVARKKGSPSDDGRYGLHASLEELQSLAETAGLVVVRQLHQKVDKPNPATLIGSGKLEEIRKTVEKEKISTVIFDEELSPVQLMNIEKSLGEDVRVCDRTALTLDIFSQHALSREGKLQVELAQYEYQLPRLTRMWTHLERQVAGAGGDQAVKGMGEKQIEVDKRLLRHRITSIRRELKEVKLHRRLKRHRRAEQDLPVVTLVGYTNAGKSTLLNRMTDAEVLVEDKLFATLDPTTRRLKLPGGKTALLTDTVGFIQKLPPQLVAAFGATLEELTDSSLLLHVVDMSSVHREKQRKAVAKVLDTLGVINVPILTVWNKADALSSDERSAILDAAAGDGDRAVCVSAETGEGLEDLLKAVEQCMEESMVPMAAQIPYRRGDLVQRLYSQGVVRHAEHNGSGTFVEASVPLALAARLRPFRVTPDVASDADEVIAVH